MTNRAWESSLALRLSLRAAVVLLLFMVGTVPADRGVADGSFEGFVSGTTPGWCESHGKRDDLQAVVIDVRFRAEPPLFSEGEGVVVAPVAVDLPGAQRVLEIASQPGHLRKLKAQGITAVAWEYGGRVHREMRFAGMALVERPPLARVTPPAGSTFKQLPADLRPEALARAVDLEEHNLHKCAAFSEWCKRSAGPPPHTDQILRLVRATGNRVEKKKNEAEDLCVALREGRFTSHWAQVAVVMGAREVGIPAFGFASASPRQIHLVGTYTDQTGWILVDVEKPEDGWFTGGAALLTMAPLVSNFGASSHDFWLPEGGAYAKTQWGINGLSSTKWRGRLAAGEGPLDTTEARTLRLSEVCQ